MSQLQDILDSKEQEKYEQYQDERNTAYNNLYKLMSLYGYNTNADSKTTSSTNTSSATSGQTSLSTSFGSPSLLNQLASAAGETSIPSYSSWIKNFGESLAGDDEDVDAGTILKEEGAFKLMKKLNSEYAGDAPYRMAAIIDYLYENAYISGTVRDQWIKLSGLGSFYELLASGDYS